MHVSSPRPICTCSTGSMKTCVVNWAEVSHPSRIRRDSKHLWESQHPMAVSSNLILSNKTDNPDNIVFRAILVQYRRPIFFLKIPYRLCKCFHLPVRASSHQTKSFWCKNRLDLLYWKPLSSPILLIFDLAASCLNVFMYNAYDNQHTGGVFNLLLCSYGCENWTWSHLHPMEIVILEHGN